MRRERAARIIARKWREYAKKKENKDLEAKKKLEKYHKEQQALHEVLSKEQLRLAEWAATVMQKNWRAYKARLEHNKTLSKSSTAQKTTMQKSATPRRFGDQLFDPFAMLTRDKNNKKDTKSKAIGTYNYHQQLICIQCDEETVTR